MGSELIFRTSPSAIAEVMEADCKRALYFNSVASKEMINREFLKANYNIDLVRIKKETAIKNQFRRAAGHDLEDNILKDLKIPANLNISTYGVKGHVYPKKPSSLERMGEEETIDVLKKLADIDAFQKETGINGLKYIYQPTFMPTEAFKKEYAFDPSFGFNRSTCDLIMLTRNGNDILLSIIDIKMSQRVRLKQKIQVTLYAVLLDAVVREIKEKYGIKNIHADLNTGYIWHKGKAEPTPFDMEEVLQHVKKFLTDDVNEMCNTVRTSDDEGVAVADIPFALNHNLCRSCEYCDFFGFCHINSRRSDDYRLIPYLSEYGAKCFGELYAQHSGNTPDSNISYDDLSSMLKDISTDTDKEAVLDIISHEPDIREYVKDAGGERLVIDMYTDLLDTTRSFDYRRINSFRKNYGEEWFDNTRLVNWLDSLIRIKEKDKEFINKRISLLSSCECSEEADQRNIEYITRYQNKKLEEIESVIELASSISERLTSDDTSGEDTVNIKDDLYRLSDKNLSVKIFSVKYRPVLSFPKNTSNLVKLFITAQKDEITDRMFALGYYCYIPDTFEPYIDDYENYREPHIYLVENESDFDNTERRFINDLYRLFIVLNQYNAGADSDSGQLPLLLQCFVMDGYEADNFITLLYSMLERVDIILASMIVNIISWFQDENVMNSERSGSKIPSAFPFVSLTDAVRRLFLIPADIAYSFDDIAGLFVLFNPLHKDLKRFSNYFDNSVSAGYIREYWKKPQNPKYSLARLQNHLKMRFINESVIYIGMSNELEAESYISGRKYVLSFAPEFRLPVLNDYHHTILSKLSFQVRYEEMLARLDARNQRLNNTDDLIADGKITEVVYFNEEESGYDFFGNELVTRSFRINNYSREMEIPDMGLTFSFADAGSLQSFRDSNIVFARSEYWGDFFENSSVDVDDNGTAVLQVTMKQDNAGFFDRVNTYMYMFERHTDWNTPYITGGQIMNKTVTGILRDIDISDDRVNSPLSENIISLLGDPCSFVRTVSDDSRISDEQLSAYERDYFKYPFVDSQRQAFTQFCNQNFSLVQGPPGTGKTNFIAMSVIMYLIDRVCVHGSAPQKIFITSNSHVAIENVLKKIAEVYDYLCENCNTLRLPVSIYNVNDNEESLNSDRVIRVSKGAIGNKRGSMIFNSGNAASIIAGATVWALEKPYQYGWLNKKTNTFDVVIIDEASQVRLADATIALAHVKQDGKILLVGDHEQLPPIIQGKYDTPDDEPYMAGSVFKYFIDHDIAYKNENGTFLYTKRLTDQFRMNGILSLYPSVKIYDGEYSPANDEVANRKLELEGQNAGNTGDDICGWIMDPEYPFVLCNIRSAGKDSFLTANEKKEFEIQLVKQLADYCVHNLHDEDGNLYDDPEKFWTDGMFIISPHHVHINRLRVELEDIKRNDLEDEAAKFGEYAFIDTVDKMQGQETDVALVSYGISDANQAVREKEFVFNRNRLNVSITRGKKKMILILTDALTDKQLELLAEEDQKLIDSISFINSIRTFAASSGIENGIITECDFKDDWVNDGKIVVEIYRKRMK